MYKQGISINTPLPKKYAKSGKKKTQKIYEMSHLGLKR